MRKADVCLELQDELLCLESETLTCAIIKIRNIKETLKAMKLTVVQYISDIILALVPTSPELSRK